MADGCAEEESQFSSKVWSLANCPCSRDHPTPMLLWPTLIRFSGLIKFIKGGHDVGRKMGEGSRGSWSRGVGMSKIKIHCIMYEILKE